MATNPMEAPARAAVLEDLLAAGRLRPGAQGAGVLRLRTPGEWRQWMSRTLLVLGVALLLAGVAFFFAANWDAMGRFLRLGLVEAMLLAAVAGAAWRGLDDPVGKVLLVAAAFLVGTFLAVYGQIYQTGADAFELFLGWALLILGWAWVGRSGALWLMVLALVDLTVLLWVEQVRPVAHGQRFEVAWALVGGIDLAALLLRDRVVERGGAWLESAWVRWVILSGAAGGLTTPVIPFLMEWRLRTAAPLICLVLLAWLVLREHQRPGRDLVSLTLASTCVALLTLTALGKPLFEVIDGKGALLAMSLLTVGITSALALWLRHLSRSFEVPEPRGGGPRGAREEVDHD